MKDECTETAFRLDQCKHFRKSKHLLRSEVNRCDQSSIEHHLRRSTSTSYWWVDRSTCLASRISTEKESFPRSEFKPASICRLDADRSPNAVSVHAGTSHVQVDFEVDRPPPAPPGHLLITMVKEAVFCTKNEFRKMKKSRISHWSESDENAKWLRDCLWLCQACKRGFTCRPMERNLRQEAHSYPQADIDRYLLSPFTATSVTSNNRLWSP